MNDDETRIRRVLEDIADGYRTRDADRIVGHYAPDVVKFDLAPPLRSRRGDTSDIGGGREVDMTTAEGVRTWLAGFGDAPFAYEIRDLEVAVGGDVAYAYGLASMGSPGIFTLWFRMTVGLRRAADRWQVAHLHTSTPFYMDETMRAATDLKP